MSFYYEKKTNLLEFNKEAHPFSQLATKTSDFKITIQENNQEEVILTHRFILALQSDYFKAMFQTGMQESTSHELLLKDVSIQIFKKIILFIYTGKVELNYDILLDFLINFRRFLINDLELEKAASNFIAQNIEISNVVNIFRFAKFYKFQILVNSCIKFIKKNINIFLKERYLFLSLNYEELLDILDQNDLEVDELELLKETLIWWNRYPYSDFATMEDLNPKEPTQEYLEMKQELLSRIRFCAIFPKKLFKNKEILEQLPQDLIMKFEDFHSQRTELSQDPLIEENPSYFSILAPDRSSKNFLPRFVFQESHILNNENLIYNYLNTWIYNPHFFKMRLGYSGKRDGFDSRIFHSLCDNKRNTLVLIKTSDFVVGCFTKIGFASDSQFWNSKRFHEVHRYNFIFDPDAFFFKFDLQNGVVDRFVEKSLNTLQYDIDYGPVFGSSWIWTNLGNRSLKMNSEYFQINEIEVFF
ncbi:hypothetical protein M0811_10937 [Anaeramoeba ignava]|uniref:BTB domain-containing protein n=1 Tax=Anaeramoeba ignava TaxID=1746090 RepID=A0A9Q0LDJ3_ANAIG|nr:hypothetical protein M0811_10937 [Anaeramoeba ignava]